MNEDKKRMMDIEDCRYEKTDRNATKGRAKQILEKMNAMIKGRDFAKIAPSMEFNMLNKKIHSLGWLALVKTLDIVRGPTRNELRIQLRLVSPDSREAQAIA